MIKPSFPDSPSFVAKNDVNVNVVLASQSPRRRELLSLIGIAHEVCPADIDETVLENELPVPYCLRLARAKTAAVAVQHPHALVIGSDTIVVLDSEILGKPGNRVVAKEMLTRLSSREHTVHSAIALAYNGTIIADVETVVVRFRQLSSSLIDAYVATGEPMDKAGSYGIQGYGATIVERVEGDYFAVMGLPVGRMVMMLQQLGLCYPFGPITRCSA